MNQSHHAAADRARTAGIAANAPKTELLAPAGDAEALRAAVANGADAIYFGLPAFNARQRAANFTLESLDETVALLHRHSVRAYVTLNTLITPVELPMAADYLRQIADSGADAVIIQDLGLARLAHEMVPSLPLHASTQMTLAEPEAIALVAAETGLSRVILPRELSLDEIRRIRAAGNVELEVFVHGALCISYSGQCLASQWLFKRSANRGACAQPCRLPYKLEVDGQVQPDGVAYPLSPHDLSAHQLLRDLVRAGVSGLKIEGRLKSPEYVAAVVQMYRAALDAALADRTFEPTATQRSALAASFSRGFTSGYLGGDGHHQIVGGMHSASQGVPVGTVVGHQGERLLVDLLPTETDAAGDNAAASIAAGDGIVIVDHQSDKAPAGGRVYEVQPVVDSQAEDRRRDKGRITRRAPLTAAAAVPEAGRRVVLAFGSDFTNVRGVAVGAVVCKTDDPQISRELRKSYARLTIRRPLPISITVSAAIGRGLQVEARAANGLAATVVDSTPLEAARKHPTSISLIREQFDRLGDSGYCLDEVLLVGDDGRMAAEVVPAMIPKSLLNDLRRRLVEALDQTRRSRDRHPVANPQALDKLMNLAASRNGNKRDPAQAPQLKVLLRTVEQVEGLLAATPRSNEPLAMAAIVDAAEPMRSAMLARLKDADMAVLLATPRILKLDGHSALEKLVAAAPHGLLVRHLGAIAVSQRLRPDLPLVADFSLNVANQLSAHWLLAGQGVSSFTPAAELPLEELKHIAASVGPQYVDIILHRHVPMMHMAHCIAAAWMARAPSGQTAGRHDLRRGQAARQQADSLEQAGRCRAACRRMRFNLVDRIGEKLAVSCDDNHHNTIHAPMATSAALDIEALRGMGITDYRLELLEESAEQARQLVELYCRWLTAGRAPAEALRLIARIGLRSRPS